jgi:hypothetical protein
MTITPAVGNMQPGFLLPQRESPMAFDPFDAEISTVGITEEDIHETGEQTESTAFTYSRYSENPWADFPTVGGYWTYDLEAVPDETRFPRPNIEDPVFDNSLDLEAVLKTETTLKQRLKDRMCPEQLLLLQEHESKREKGPRKGVSETIRKEMEDGDKEWREWHRLGTQPHSARIVAMGVCAFGDPDQPRTWVAKTIAEERQLLQDFFDLYDFGTTRAGYNIAGYDDRLIFWRAMRLGVKPIKPMQLNRYGGRNCCDLMLKMFNNIGDSMQLKKLLRMLNIPPPAGDMEGSQVLELVDTNQWDLLEQYVASDAWCELQLLARVQHILEL